MGEGVALSHQVAGLSPGNIHSPVWQPRLSSGRLLTPCLVSPAIFFWSVPTKPSHFPALSPVPFPLHHSGREGCREILRDWEDSAVSLSHTLGGGVSLPRAIIIPSWSPNTITEQGRGGWFTINYYRKDSPFLSLEVPPHPPARFEMPAARGKTSLNARDW